MKRLYAFWPYDLFPYFLGGEITDIDENGRVYVPSYQGWFRPAHVTSIDGGVKLQDKLDDLKKEYEAARKRVDVEFETLLRDALANTRMSVSGK